jgi:hypothetical protein
MHVNSASRCSHLATISLEDYPNVSVSTYRLGSSGLDAQWRALPLGGVGHPAEKSVRDVTAAWLYSDVHWCELCVPDRPIDGIW